MAAKLSRKDLLNHRKNDPVFFCRKMIGFVKVLSLYEHMFYNGEYNYQKGREKDGEMAANRCSIGFAIKNDDGVTNRLDGMEKTGVQKKKKGNTHSRAR